MIPPEPDQFPCAEKCVQDAGGRVLLSPVPLTVQQRACCQGRHVLASPNTVRQSQIATRVEQPLESTLPLLELPPGAPSWGSLLGGPDFPGLRPVWTWWVPRNMSPKARGVPDSNRVGWSWGNPSDELLKAVHLEMTDMSHAAPCFPTAPTLKQVRNVRRWRTRGWQSTHAARTCHCGVVCMFLGDSLKVSRHAGLEADEFLFWYRTVRASCSREPVHPPSSVHHRACPAQCGLTSSNSVILANCWMSPAVWSSPRITFCGAAASSTKWRPTWGAPICMLH